MSPHNDDAPSDPRRQFFKVCIGGATVVTIGTVTYPIVAFLQLPEIIGGNKPVEIPLDRLAVGQAQYVEFQGQQLIVLMLAEGPRVFSASCPHLGCNVIWDTATSSFHCPCHGAKFTAEGVVVSGPVSAPLTEIPFEVTDGRIIIT